MKVKVAREELLKKLALVKAAIDVKSQMPVLLHILMEADRKGAPVVLYGSDMDRFVRVPLEAEVEKGGRACIPAKPLAGIAKEVEGEILIETEDGWADINADKTGFKLALADVSDFPNWPEAEGGFPIEIPGAELASMLERTAFAAGESGYTLNGVLFHLIPRSKKLTMVGTDGHRMAIFTRKIEDIGASRKETKAIVPKKAVVELKKLMKEHDSVKLTFTENMLFIDSEGLNFVCRLIDGTYPNYSQVIPKHEKALTADRGALLKALRRASIIAESEKERAVKFEVAGDEARVSSVHPDIGEASDTLPVDYKGDPMALGVNSSFVIEALGMLATEKVRLELGDSLSAVLIVGEGDEDYKNVVMPIRI